MAEPVWNQGLLMYVDGALTPVSSDVKVYDRYLDLPSPTTVETGTLAVVAEDDEDAKRGLHVAIGTTPGDASYWIKT